MPGNQQQHIDRKRAHGCQNPKKCGASSDIVGNLTFGWGELDHLGYWEHDCLPCTQACRGQQHIQDIKPGVGK